jgi:hypothetical protein
MYIDGETALWMYLSIAKSVYKIYDTTKLLAISIYQNKIFSLTHIFKNIISAYLVMNKL